MGQTITREVYRSIERPRRRRGWIVVLVLLVLLAVAGGVLLFVLSGDGDDPVDVVERAWDAWNDGDVELYDSLFAPGTGFYGQEYSLPYVEFNMGIESHIDYECAAQENAPQLVDCTWTTTDGLYTPAGIVDVGNGIARVEDGIITAWGSDIDYDDPNNIERHWNAYTFRLKQWLRAEHPDVADQVVLGAAFVKSREAGALLIQYVPEFLAQSDDYPLP